MDQQGARERLLDAAMAHVPFDGWGDTTFAAAQADSGVAPGLARALFPRGGLDLALAYHARGDAAMAEALARTDLSAMRMRDRIAHAIMLRLALADREAVRRGMSLFALPHLAAEGARAMWGTADAIWTALGDTSDDVNWYSKRASLSAVYGATVLFWLGDDSPDLQATRDFVDRRIEGVMRFEKFKAGPVGRALALPLALLPRIRAPQRADNLPGQTGQRS